MQLPHPLQVPQRLHVSILTRPEGRVQRAQLWPSPAVQMFQSSPGLLTRPEGRVQPQTQNRSRAIQHCFNPHPARRPGATPSCPSTHHSSSKFQSSPGQKAGCNPQLLQCHRELRGFNPHPARRPGATSNRRYTGQGVPLVSILTRPEGRVQLVTCDTSEIVARGFNPHPARRPGATTTPPPRNSARLCFNPHPARRPGATQQAHHPAA